MLVQEICFRLKLNKDSTHYSLNMSEEKEDELEFNILPDIIFIKEIY